MFQTGGLCEKTLLEWECGEGRDGWYQKVKESEYDVRLGSQEQRLFALVNGIFINILQAEV